MDSYLVLLLLVASVSCHNWYKGPYHFYLDVVQPGPFIGSGGRSEIPSGIDPTNIDSIRLPAEAFATGDPTISPIGLGLDVNGAAPGLPINIAPASPTIDNNGKPKPGISSAGPMIDSIGEPEPSISSAGPVIDNIGEPNSPIRISSAGPVIDNIGEPLGISSTAPVSSVDTAQMGSGSDGSILRHGPTMDPLGVPVNIDGGYTNIDNVISGKSIIPVGNLVGAKAFLRHGANIDPIGGYYISQSEGYLKEGSGLHRILEGNDFYKIGSENLYPLEYSKYGHYANTYLPGTKGIKWFKGAEKFLHFYRTQHKRGTSSGYKTY